MANEAGIPGRTTQSLPNSRTDQGVCGIFAPNHDLHNHTSYCDHADSDATVVNMAAKAAARGLSFLGISEHVRYPAEVDWVNAIREDIRSLGSGTPPGTPRILLGAELDPDPIKLDGSFRVDVPNLDYRILSIHFIPGIGKGIWEFHDLGYDIRQRRRLGRQWLEWVEACIVNGDFDIYGHPLRFPIELDLLDLQDDAIFGEARRVLGRLAERGAAFDLNDAFAATLARIGKFDAYAALVSELRGAGVRFSRGSDSHTAGRVGEWGSGALLAERAGLMESDWVDPAGWA